MRCELVQSHRHFEQVILPFVLVSGGIISGLNVALITTPFGRRPTQKIAFDNDQQIPYRSNGTGDLCVFQY